MPRPSKIVNTPKLSLIKKKMHSEYLMPRPSPGMRTSMLSQFTREKRKKGKGKRKKVSQRLCCPNSQKEKGKEKNEKRKKGKGKRKKVSQMHSDGCLMPRPSPGIRTSMWSQFTKGKRKKRK